MDVERLSFAVNVVSQDEIVSGVEDMPKLLSHRSLKSVRVKYLTRKGNRLVE